MKDYEHQILWLDYFNKNLSKRKGRKVSKNKTVFDPSMDELVEAAKLAGYEIVESNNNVRYPRRTYTKSSYIVIKKKDSKSSVLKKIGDMLVQIRSRKSN
jgi:signal recognition particle subunit SRP19